MYRAGLERDHRVRVSNLMRIKAIVALAIVLAINFGGWYLLNRPVAQRSWDGMIASVSFTPYQADQSPHDKKYPSVDQIDRDMALVSRVAAENQESVCETGSKP